MLASVTSSPHEASRCANGQSARQLKHREAGAAGMVRLGVPRRNGMVIGRAVGGCMLGAPRSRSVHAAVSGPEGDRVRHPTRPFRHVEAGRTRRVHVRLHREVGEPLVRSVGRSDGWHRDGRSARFPGAPGARARSTARRRGPPNSAGWVGDRAVCSTASRFTAIEAQLPMAPPGAYGGQRPARTGGERRNVCRTAHPRSGAPPAPVPGG